MSGPHDNAPRDPARSFLAGTLPLWAACFAMSGLLIHVAEKLDSCKEQEEAEQARSASLGVQGIVSAGDEYAGAKAHSEQADNVTDLLRNGPVAPLLRRDGEQQADARDKRAREYFHPDSIPAALNTSRMAEAGEANNLPGGGDA